MTIEKELRDCFISALRDEKNGKKHKGLLYVKIGEKEAEEYIIKAKKNLELCRVYKEQEFDYKLPEEWYYILYYCALAILAKFGLETRSQKYTALFLKYAKDKKLIEYDDELIRRIMVFKEKDKNSDVDKREKARYGPSIIMKDVAKEYEDMMNLCRKAISQCEGIIYSNEKFEIPKEFLM